MTRRSALVRVVKKDGTHQLVVGRLIGLLLFWTLCVKLLYLIAHEGSPNCAEAALEFKNKMLKLQETGKSVASQRRFPLTASILRNI